jgi:hypothetical protein
MNTYFLENLTWQEFEELVILICQEILGIAAQKFADGKDGARDSSFDATAKLYPSENDPWNGVFIIQAKHTKTINASTSDKDFFEYKSSHIKKEIKRLKEVKEKEHIDNYIIFTNRKNSGTKYSEIIKYIKDELQIENVAIIGKESIESYLNKYPHVAHSIGLSKFMFPLRFREKNIKEVIIAFSETIEDLTNNIENYLQDYTQISKERKNELNNLGKEYFEFIKEHSLPYFNQIEEFLKSPSNTIFTRKYSNTVSDLQAKILLERDRFGEFQHLLEHIIDYVVENNKDDLEDFSSVVRVFVHFMYFNCDIGKKNVAST